MQPSRDGGRVPVHLLEPPSAHVVALALDREPLERSRGDRVRDEGIGGLPDQDLPRLGRLLEALGDDHRLSRDEPLALARVAGDHLARVHPDAHVEAELPGAVQHVVGGAHRPQRVVLVGRGDAEDRHDLVADELLDRPAVTLDDRAHRLEVAPLHAPVGLGISLCQPGRVHEVAEDDRHGLPHLACGAHAASLSPWRAVP